MAKLLEKVGRAAFIIGVIIAVIIGVFGDVSGGTLTVLVILGLIVGLLNITQKETTGFLIAAISLILVSALSKDVLTSIKNILDAILALVAPATVIVSLRAIYSLAARK